MNNNNVYTRDRSFNMQGGVGGYGFLFRSEIFFLDNARVKIFFSLQNSTLVIRLYDKNSESDFFFLHQNQNIFFSNIGNQNIFLEKKPYPPWKLNGLSLSTKSKLQMEFNKEVTSASSEKASIYRCWWLYLYMKL